MEQEQINIEDIMKEIRAEIRAKGYVDNEIPFSDIACLVGGTEVPFDLKDYLDDISMMDESRTVLAYRDISSTRKGVSCISDLSRSRMRSPFAGSSLSRIVILIPVVDQVLIFW